MPDSDPSTIEPSIVRVPVGGVQANRIMNEANHATAISRRTIRFQRIRNDLAKIFVAEVRQYAITFHFYETDAEKHGADGGSRLR